MTEQHFIQRKLSIPYSERIKDEIPTIKLLGSTGQGYTSLPQLKDAIKLIEQQRPLGERLRLINVYDGGVYEVTGTYVQETWNPFQKKVAVEES